MTLNVQQLAKLNRIIALAQKLVAESKNDKGGSRNGTGKKRRIRRTGKELSQFRKMLKAELRKGSSVAELARKHGVSSTYIYMLP